MFPEHPFSVVLIPYVRLFYRGISISLAVDMKVQASRTNLFFQGHLGNKCCSLLIGLGPVTRSITIGCFVLACNTACFPEKEIQRTRGVNCLRLPIEVSIGSNVTLCVAKSTDRQHGCSQC